MAEGIRQYLKQIITNEKLANISFKFIDPHHIHWGVLKYRKKN